MLGAMTLRWGFLGPGRIAATVADDLALLDDATPLAVAGRDLGRAREFAAGNGFDVLVSGDLPFRLWNGEAYRMRKLPSQGSGGRGGAVHSLP